MSTKYLIVPNTGQKLADGDIVVLSRFPGMKWIVHCGWYTYYNNQYSGWYFSSIPSNTILPVSDEDLALLSIVSSSNSSSGSASCDCGCNHDQMNAPVMPNPPGPIPPGHPPGRPGLHPEQKDELSRSWISVDTIVDRDQLNRRNLPHGKVVRVNYTDDGPKYYVWNIVKREWEDVNFGFNPDEYLKATEIEEQYAKKSVEQNVKDLKEDVTNIKQDVKLLKEGPEWQKLPEVEGEE